MKNIVTNMILALACIYFQKLVSFIFKIMICCYVTINLFLNKIMNLSSYKLVNAICYYIAVCILLFIIWFIICVFFAFLIKLIKIIENKSEEKILGKKHEKSLNYNSFQIWFIKVQADIEILISWVECYICKIQVYKDKKRIRKIKMFTFEGLFAFLKKCWNFFFNKSFLHIFSATYVIYIFYNDKIKSLIGNIYSIVTSIKISNINEYVNVILIAVLSVYLIFNLRYKVSGYREIQIERFKQLFQMEEKLLNIIIHMSIELENNIEAITNMKSIILQFGIQNLTGNECFIGNNTIKYNDKSNRMHYYSNNLLQFNKLSDMEKEFKKLLELDEEFKNSSLACSNIFMVDQNAQLTRFVRIYFPGYMRIENIENMKMELLCKSSVEKWFENMFIEPTNFQNKKEYKSKEYGITIAFKKSAELDINLKEAFKLESNMKICIRKLEKRIKKLHIFSKYNPN